MTAIVGLVDEGTVWLGGDSGSVARDLITQRQDPKVFRVCDMLIGGIGSWRLSQLMQHSFRPPLEEGTSGTEYMVTKVVPVMRRIFSEGGWNEKHEGNDSGGCFLIGWRGELFVLHSDYQVGRELLPYHAIGSGQEIALGSLHASQVLAARNPSARLVLALEAAEEFITGVTKPFTIISEGET